MHMIFISPTFYKKKNVYAQENFCGVFSSMVTFFSAYTN